MKPYIIAALAVGLAAYVFIGIPLLTAIVAQQGIMAGYPLEVAAVLVLIYLFAAQLLRSRKLFVIFMLAFLVQDIIMPPIMVPLEGATALSPGQQIAGDVFLYAAFTSMGFAHLTAWLLTYLAVPFLLLLALAYELRTKRLSSLVPHVIG